MSEWDQTGADEPPRTPGWDTGMPADPAWGQRTQRGLASGMRLFGRYVLDRQLGRGGMGVVWLAVDEELGDAVALKFLPEELVHDQGALDELRDETRKSRRLTHPNIVRVHDFHHDAVTGLAAISMEYVDGPSLAALRLGQPAKVFEVDGVADYMRQLCDALQYAHRRGIIHRDLKPANLMVNSAGELRVCDFGIACSIRDSVTRVTGQRGVSGTLAYMSPQQAMGEPSSPSDDIYAIGSTIYELLTGRPPFYGGDISLQIRDKVPPPMAQRRLELGVAGGPISSEWEAVVAACLAKGSEWRPKDASDLSLRLSSHGRISGGGRSTIHQETLLRAVGGVSRQSGSHVKKVVPVRRAFRGLLPALLIAGLVGGLGAAVYSLWRSAENRVVTTAGFRSAADFQAFRDAMTIAKEGELRRAMERIRERAVRPSADPALRSFYFELRAALGEGPTTPTEIAELQEAAVDGTTVARILAWDASWHHPDIDGKMRAVKVLTQMGSVHRIPLPERAMRKAVGDSAETMLGTRPAGLDGYRWDERFVGWYHLRAATGDNDARQRLLQWVNDPMTDRIRREAASLALLELGEPAAEKIVQDVWGEQSRIEAINYRVSISRALGIDGGKLSPDEVRRIRDWATKELGYSMAHAFGLLYEQGIRAALELLEATARGDGVYGFPAMAAVAELNRVLGGKALGRMAEIRKYWRAELAKIKSDPKEAASEVGQTFQKVIGRIIDAVTIEMAAAGDGDAVKDVTAELNEGMDSEKVQAALKVGDHHLELAMPILVDIAKGTERPAASQQERLDARRVLLESGTGPAKEYLKGLLKGGDAAIRFDAACRLLELQVEALPKAVPVAESINDKGVLSAADAGGPSAVAQSLEAAFAGARAGQEMENSIGMRFCWCPPGEFLMGSPANEEGRNDDETQHRVRLTRGFWLGKHEVTQEEWARVMGTNPSHFQQAGSRAPVEQVRWEDAVAFCAKLTELERVSGRLAEGWEYRLPAEAQWEYGCRAGTIGPYAGDLDRMGWHEANSGNTTHPVGGKAANAWGLRDMHGNVWEWCADRYGDYPSGTATDPMGVTSGWRNVSRGGGWSNLGRSCRSAARHWFGPGTQNSNLGFRVAAVRRR